MTTQQLLSKYKAYEAINAHDLCAKLLVDHFGSEEEQEAIAKINLSHAKRGYILQTEIDERRRISQKYYAILKG